MYKRQRKYILPPADAVINPKQPGCGYPFKGLCGAGVAWKLVCYLYSQSGIPEKEQEDFLEFVGIATVGDVMDLQGENSCLLYTSRRQPELRAYKIRRAETDFL